MAYNTWAEYNVYGEAALTPVSATISFTNTISGTVSQAVQFTNSIKESISTAVQFTTTIQSSGSTVEYDFSIPAQRVTINIEC